jgi:hypothetical protein
MSAYSRKHKKRLELYFRCLSSVCIDSMLGYYYIPYEFHMGERWIRNRVLKKTLAYWRVKDKTSLEEQIHFLLQDGHCQEYKDIHAKLQALTFAVRERYVENSKEDAQYDKLLVVHKYMSLLPSADIAALGGGWAIMLARIGRVYGLLSKREAWEIDLQAARYLQQHYSSWEEYLTAFAVGTHFITNSTEVKHVRHILNMASTIVGGSSLALEKARWNQNLLPDRDLNSGHQDSISV